MIPVTSIIQKEEDIQSLGFVRLEHDSLFCKKDERQHEPWQMGQGVSSSLSLCTQPLFPRPGQLSLGFCAISRVNTQRLAQEKNRKTHEYQIVILLIKEFKNQSSRMNK